MKTIHTLTFIAVLALLATGVQAQAPGEPLSGEELGFLEELAFEPFCPNQTASATVCVGDQLCFNGGSDWKYPVYDNEGQPTCPGDDWDLTTVNSVDKACEAAEDVAGEPANCPNPQDPYDPEAPYCKEGTVTPTPRSNSMCCTVTNTRTCMLINPKQIEHTPR